MSPLTIRVPGEPCAQGRPKAALIAGHIRVYDPQKSRSWKGAAQVHYQAALAHAGLTAPAFHGALELRVFAVFTCPKSQFRKQPVARRPKAGRPDPDNLAKACMDSGNGLLWDDDAQIARLVVEKVVGAQGEAPFVELTVRELLGVQPAPRAASAKPLDLFADVESRS